jgi:hypothetical protein
MTESGICSTCEGTGFTAQSVLVLALGILAIVVVWGGVSKLCSCCEAKHLLRVALHPGRILITYFQVGAALGDVMNFRYPGALGDVMNGLRPVFDFVQIVFKLLGPSECFGVTGFLQNWLMRVVGLPLICLSIISAKYLFNRWRHGTAHVDALANAKDHGFFAVFYCYPIICFITFAAFICKNVSSSTSVLETDDSVVCESEAHGALQIASLIVICIVSCGLPLVFGYVLIKAAWVPLRALKTLPSEAVQPLVTTLESDSTQRSPRDYYVITNDLLTAQAIKFRTR